MAQRLISTVSCLIGVTCCALVLLTGVPGPAEANWLTKLVREAAETGGSAARKVEPLARASAQLKRLTPLPERVLVAASVSPEGHWTFVNRAGQRFTAANTDEMARVARNLTSDPGAMLKGLDIVVADEVIFADRAAFKMLPPGSHLRLAAHGDVYRVRGDFQDPVARLALDIKPNVQLQLSSLAALQEGLWQLSRSLKAAQVRVLALESGGPETLKSVAGIDPKSRRPLADRIDPYKLARSLPALRGQTVVVSARIENGNLVFRGASGSERSVDLKAIISAAERSDVNLIILNARAPRQPGDRNWLWQRVTIDGLDDALGRATKAEFLSALAGDGRMVVAVGERGPRRTVILAQAAPGSVSVSPSGQLGAVLAEVVSEVAGTVLSNGIRMDLVQASRQKELDLRIVPYVPSDLQFAYIGLLFVGLMSLAVARDWWARLWPPEQRAEYAQGIGFVAAWLVRWVLFVFVFLPIVAPLAFIWGALCSIFGWLMLPVRWVSGRSERPAATSE